MWDGSERRESGIPETFVDFEVMMERAAKHGAQRALETLGLGDSDAREDLRDLRGMLASLRLARSTAFITIVRVISGAIILAIVAYVVQPWNR